MLDKLIADFPTDESIIFDVIWSLNYSLAYPGKVKIIIEHGFHQFLISHIMSPVRKIKKTAMKTIVGMTSASNDLMQILLECNLIEKMALFFQSVQEDSKSEILLGFSNIALCNLDQKRQLTQHSIFSVIVNDMDNYSEKIQSEASYIFAHLLQTQEIGYVAELLQIYPLLLSRFFDAIKKRQNDANLVMRNLDALENLLKNQEALNINLTFQIESEGVLDSLEGLQNHKSNAIYEKAHNIISQFFSEEDEAPLMLQNDAPNADPKQPGNYFNF